MSVAKTIEINSSSEKSFEDAINKGIQRASKTIHQIHRACVKEQYAVVRDGKITEYHVDMKLTFVLDE